MSQYGNPPGPPSYYPPPAARRRNWWVLGVVAGLVVIMVLSLVAVVGYVVVHRLQDQPQAGDNGVAGGVTCSYTADPKGSAGRTVRPPQSTGVPSRGLALVEMKTNQGQLSLALDRIRTPCTVNSFVSLALQKYFDGTTCHRLTTAGLYVLQCGDPGGTGSGGPGYSFGDEGLPTDTGTPITYPAGTVAMANAGPGTNGSQFFIVYRDSPLPPAYPTFGRVVSGLAVVEQVGAAGSEPVNDGRPKTPVNIASVTVR